MLKWYEKVKNDASCIVAGRVRLARNWDEYRFPNRLEDAEAQQMIRRLKDKMRDLPDRDGTDYEYRDLLLAGEAERGAMRERKLLNRTLAEKKTPGGMIVSEDESVSIVLNGDDHIRMQVLAPGGGLAACYERVNALDDYVNEKVYYAFSPKYGYLTSYPTNVGTGMRAALTLHLPSLAASKRFPEFIAAMGRFGCGVRGVYGRNSENIGDLYEVFNQRTLGTTEKETMDRVAYVAGQITDQEKQIRESALEKHRLVREDEAAKAYGVLRYARKLSMKEAMTYLSHVRAGIADGLLKPAQDVSIYGIMIEVQPAMLSIRNNRPLEGEEAEAARAELVREMLPELL